jgi:acyl carrier protein
MSVKLRIRQILRDTVGSKRNISAIGDTDNLFAAGLTSHDAMGLMIAIEEAFNTEFPDHLIHRDTFASVSAIAEALEQVGVTKAAT